jgi:hypothetical protein
MKTFLQFLFVLSLLLITACSSSFVVSSSSEDTSIDEFNNFVLGQEAEIILRDTTVNNATNVYLSTDSLSWNEPENILKGSVAKSDVRKVIINSKLIGGLEWWGVGMLAGGIAGLLTAWPMAAAADPQSQTGWYYVILIPIGVVVGALAGITTGIIIGHSYEFIISDY